jgi:hypothetical protein
MGIERANFLARFIAGSFLVLSAPSMWAHQAFGTGSQPILINQMKNDVSAPLRDMAIPVQVAPGTQRQAPVPLPTGPMITSARPDPVAQQPTGSLVGVSTILNFPGQSADGYVPPDTNGAIGATQFVQTVNVTVAVYDKRTGALLLGPTPMNAIWSGFGGSCETSNGGDPVVLYDQLAGRWLVSQIQFNSAPYLQCVAVSTTSDATGSYNRYAFSFGNDLNDYPKFGVWPDAYYFSANMFANGVSFIGAQACAFDRAAMLAGNTATAICFQEPPTVASLLPSNLDGSTLPPTASPNFFVEIADSTDVNLFRFHADFASPANSTFTGPAVIPVAPFSEICNRAINLACIPEPPPGERVDGLGDRLMYRLAYRNFGDHESLVVNHTVAGGPLAGVRWYEIRSPEASPFVFQQGTVVDPSTDFWMGSIGMDKDGDIALGFSASSFTLDPSINIVGRVPSDPLDTMELPLSVVSGTGVQEASFHRWGDYSSMAIDPKDGCIFWYTQEYYKTSGSFNWTTRISAFKFDSCK